MKTSIATTRYMDGQGRVILPAHIRKKLNLTPGKIVEIALEGGTIKIRPTEERCVICGEPVTNKAHMTYKDKIVCEDCLEGMKKETCQ